MAHEVLIGQRCIQKNRLQYNLCTGKTNKNSGGKVLQFKLSE